MWLFLKTKKTYLDWCLAFHEMHAKMQPYQIAHIESQTVDTLKNHVCCHIRRVLIDPAGAQTRQMLKDTKQTN